MGEDESFIHDIVSEGVCADLLDYLERDRYFCNLGSRLEHRYLDDLRLRWSNADGGYGNSPAKRRIFLQLCEGDHDHGRESLGDLVRLLKATLAFAEKALFHPAKLATCAMLSRAYQEYRASQPGEAWLYYQSDDTLLKELCAWEEESGRNEADCRSALGLATLLNQRRLHQPVAAYGEAAFEGALGSRGDVAVEPVSRRLHQPEYRRSLEDGLAGMVGCRPGSVLLYVASRKMAMKAGRMDVRWRGEETTLGEVAESVTVRECGSLTKAYRRLWTVWLFAAREVDAARSRMLKQRFERMLAVLGEEATRPVG